MKNQRLFGQLMSEAKSKAQRSILAIGLLAAVSSTGCSSQQPRNVYEQIIQNIAVQETKGIDIQSIDTKIQQYIDLVDVQGAFTDIDYTDHAQTAWTPMNHITRMKDMVVCYVTPESRYYGNKELHKCIVNLMSYWYSVNPTSTNWWFHEIGWAQPMGLSLSLMRTGKEQVPDTLEHKILERMKQVSKGPDQPGSQGTGANKMDIALQWIYRTCLQEDKENLEFAIDQFFYPIQFNSGQGIQSDYSYLQHGPQLYTGGYGASVLNAFLKVAYYVEGTTYAKEEKNKLMGEFVRYGNIPFIRGKNMLFNAQGRGIGRINNSDRSILADGFSKLIKLDDTYTETYEASIERLKGNKPASYKVAPWHQHFWRADYTVHQRPTYTMDVRTASTRTLRCENGNGENLLGYFITEGSTGIVRHGNEYNNIFPSWDWSHVPGTTTPSVKDIPLPPEWGNSGQSTFTGGVSDGIYGVTAYQMIDKEFDINTSGKKAWFFFDKEVVCMGNDIQSTNKQPIHTTVNQCLAKGNIEIQTTDNQCASVQVKESKQYQNLLCVTHDSISYYFPESGRIYLSNETQTGSWKDLCKHQPDTPVSQSVFKLWFDHGRQPKNASYLYYVVPNTASTDEAIRSIDRLKTINKNNVQAVYNEDLQILGIVFYAKGSIQINDIEVSSSTPSTVMLTHLDCDTIKVYVADPSYKLSTTSLTIKTPHLEKTTINCELKTDVHYAGSTHKYEVCQHTSEK